MRSWALAILAVIAIGYVAQTQLESGDDGGGDRSADTRSADTPGTETRGEEGAAIAATLELIESDGPFPHRADGEVFENREGLLPDRPRGYYHSYTVETPGSADRGARRIITGEGGEIFYTRDHYDSFEPL
jgi:ribonuclease T1